MQEQMFDKPLISKYKCRMIKSRNFEECSCWERRDYIMSNVSKQLIIGMVKKIDDSDEKFLRQLYTILKRHLERGKH